MQIKKESIRTRILEAAREEFRDKNYEKASIRIIAQNAGVTPSNIYNYFENKDDIFRNILEPLINKIEMGKQALTSFEFDRHDDHPQDLDAHHEIVVQTANFVNENREDLNILVFNSEGSSLGNYIDDLVDWFTVEFKKSFGEKAQHEIDDFFVHITTAIWVNSIREALMHDIGGERLINVAEDLMTFVFSGWNKIMEKKGIHEH